MPLPGRSVVVRRRETAMRTDWLGFLLALIVLLVILRVFGLI